MLMIVLNPHVADQLQTSGVWVLTAEHELQFSDDADGTRGDKASRPVHTQPRPEYLVAMNDQDKLKPYHVEYAVMGRDIDREGKDVSLGSAEADELAA